MIEAEWHDYATGGELAVAVAEHIQRVISDALETRGEALIAIPGGRSPIPIFECLAELDVVWANVTIIPTEDRLVVSHSPLSNYARISRYFVPKGAQVVPIVVDGATDCKTPVHWPTRDLAELRWPPDLVWLGMGTMGILRPSFRDPI
jgi:6-phosphogluconolactonase